MIAWIKGLLRVYIIVPLAFSITEFLARLQFRASGYNVQKTIAAAEVPADKRARVFCIFVLYQENVLEENVVRCAKGLHDKGIAILAVNNANLTSGERDRLKPYCWHYTERQNWGRDFGGYQHGALLLRKFFQRTGAQPEKIIFCNDSVIVLPDRFSVFLDEHVLKNPRPWIGVTENHTSQYHVSSWFFCISGTIWNHQKFQAFWDLYVPLDHRPYTIARGEIGLSKTIASIGYGPAVVYSADYFIGTVIAKKDVVESGEAYLLFPESVFVQGRHWRKLLDKKNWLIANISFYQEIFNQTHFWQMWAVKYCHFPFIKKDIAYRKKFELRFLHQVRHLMSVLKAAGYDEALIAEAENAIFSRHVDFLPPLQKFFWRYGII